jgi:DNA-binding beta-propeller fold protein YncE
VVTAVLAVVIALIVGPARSAILPGGPPKTTIDNYGRIVAPRGRLTELGYFVTGSALTPDGRFLWTVGAGRTANDVEIVRTADGKVIQTLDDPSQALSGGLAISPDGRHAYVSDTHDAVGVRTYTIDPRTGRAQAGPTIPLPPPSFAPLPDNFPPQTNRQSYATGEAISPDGRTLVVALNLADAAAVIDLVSRRVAYVNLDTGTSSLPGDHALPEGVAIAGHEAFIANEGNGTVSAFDYTDPPSTATAYTPQPAIADPANIDPTKTHPFQIIASPDGRKLFVSETNADRVLELRTADPGAAATAIYVRRSEGLGTDPLGIALSPDGGTLYVADAMENAVRAVALTTRQLRVPRGGASGAGGLVNLRPGSLETVPAGDTFAMIPTGIYPDRVAVDPRTDRLEIISAMGLGPGPTANSNTAAGGYGDPQQDSIRILSTLQTFSLPRTPAAADTALLALGRGGAQAAVPADRTPAPPGSPVVGPGGGASTKIKYVFLVIAENKTYDSVLGDLGRSATNPLVPGPIPVGNGDPCLVIFGLTRSLPHRRDGAPCPQSRFLSKDVAIRDPGMRMDGTPITPNQHRLALRFVDLDNLYADTTTSDDGHLFTASGYPDDYELRGTEANNGPSPRPFDIIYPQVAPPHGFLFDLMAQSGISFYNYGEAVSGTLIPDTGLSPSERLLRADVLAHTNIYTYPSSVAIDVSPISVGGNLTSPPNAAVGDERVDDSDQPGETYLGTSTPGTLGATVPPRLSRIATFLETFDPEVGSPGCLADPGDPRVCDVPQFNYMVLPNNHTAGTIPGRRTPDALVRDNDLAIGQLVDHISHSPIWPYTAIFVMQDDSQDGADHLDAHRITGFLISPWARHGAVDSTHYDQAGIIHTIELILGVRPEYFSDALATPLYTAFSSTPNLTPFSSTPIAQPLLDEVNPPSSPMAKVSEAQNWVTDHVNPNLVNQIQWAYRYGTDAACPALSYHPCTVTSGRVDP